MCIALCFQTSSPRRAHAEPTPSRIAERRDHFSEFRGFRFRIFFSMPFWIDFRSIFARFCFPTWLQKLTEIAKRSMPRCIPSWAHSFDRFSVDFCSQLPSKNPEKSCPRCSGSTIFEKSPFEVNIDFWSHFGFNFASFWHPKPEEQSSNRKAQRQDLGSQNFPNAPQISR